MLANYGYKDGSGDYFITINTDGCTDCADHPCVNTCPAGLLEIIEDDYDDEVAAVKEESRHKLKYACAPCKPVSDRPPLPCVEACPASAIEHSW
jgi:NAD-dependent dihydropyrimidine dehydrogenase PreA subunit